MRRVRLLSSAQSRHAPVTAAAPAAIAGSPDVEQPLRERRAEPEGERGDQRIEDRYDDAPPSVCPTDSGPPSPSFSESSQIICTDRRGSAPQVFPPQRTLKHCFPFSKYGRIVIRHEVGGGVR